MVLVWPVNSCTVVFKLYFGGHFFQWMVKSNGWFAFNHIGLLMIIMLFDSIFNGERKNVHSFWAIDFLDSNIIIK